MVEIIGVGFMKANKIYYFDPAGVSYELGELVIVETARGMELGHISIANCEIDESELVAPLKGVERKATKEDIQRYKDNLAKRDDAMKVCEEDSAAQAGYEACGCRIYDRWYKGDILLLSRWKD